MKLVHSNFDVYSTKIYKYCYNDNYFRYVLIKNCRLSGFEETKHRKLDVVDIEESERCSISRTKRNIKELALCNEFEYFYTQTISPKICDRYDLEQIQELIQKRFKAYKRKNKNFKYLIIYEHHKDGAIHIHGLVKGLNFEDIYLNDNIYMSSKFFDKIGYNSFSSIKNYNRCCNYITKYISSDMVKNSHNQLYFCSKGLKKATRTEIDYVEDMDWSYENDFVKICEVQK